ncbi:MAG: diguanylate cyclase [Candidatus Thiodiazotropha taylori]
MFLKARFRYLQIFLVFLVLTPMLFWISSKLSRQHAMTELATETEEELMLFARKLEDYLTGFDYLSNVIVTSREITNLLGNPLDQSTVKTANSYLSSLNEQVHASAIYVMDREGNTLAASNWQLEKSFVGKNYGFRPYFRTAMSGAVGRDVAVGATSGKLGYYIARPVFDTGSDKALGVVVIKVSLEELRLFFSDLSLSVLVADQDGVIFLASEKRWQFKTLRPLTSTEISGIQKNRRYGNEPLMLWPLKRETYWDEFSKTLVLDDGEEYLAQGTMLLSFGWEMHVLMPTDDVDEHLFFAMVASGLFTALALLSVILLIQRRDYLQDLREAAIHDFLTGLYTRRYMQGAALAQIGRINRGHVSNIAAAMIDIDHFKAVNDQYGHRAGDQVLKEVGRAIITEIRRGDIPVRYGGEEFLVIINTHQSCDASHTVRRILKSIRDLHFRGPIRSLHITASAGVAHYTKDEELEDLLNRADELLYRAKQDGRDRFYDDKCNKPEEQQ